MKINFRYIATLTIAFMLSGCGMGDNGKASDQAQAKQNKLTEDLYGPLVGTYEGVMTQTDHGDEKVELSIYLVGKPSPNPDGTPGTRRLPQAVFRRTSPVILDYTLDVSGFTPENGLVNLASPDTAVSSVAIPGKVKGRTIQGPLQTSAGTVGQINVTWVRAETDTGEAPKDRLMRIYKQIEGTYVGTINTLDPKHPTLPVIIRLSAIASGSSAILRGYYERPDLDKGPSDPNLVLTVDYNTDVSPPQINMHGNGGGKYILDFSGTLEGDVLTCDVVSQFSGNMGTLIAKRSTAPGASPSADLYAEYVKVAGNYTATVTQTVRKKKTTIVFVVTLTAAMHGASPALEATISRSDKSASAPHKVSANYDPKTQAFSVDGQPGDGSTLTIKGKLANQKITGSASSRSDGSFGNVVFVAVP